jgi:hypothetical protein
MRPWQEIARELANEPDPKKVLELSLELNEAMKEQLDMKIEPDTPPTPINKTCWSGSGCLIRIKGRCFSVFAFQVFINSLFQSSRYGMKNRWVLCPQQLVA